MNKTFITHYVNLNNISLLYGLLKDVNKNTAIAALIIPHSAAWCEADIAIEKRNTVTLDKEYMHKYCNAMHITERTFKKIVKELQPVILRKKSKDIYYVNPFFCSHGDGRHVAEFREYCVKNKLFIPFSFINKACKSINEEHYNYILDNVCCDTDDRRRFIMTAKKNEEELQEILEKDALSYKHNCLYTNLDRVSKYTAFVDAKLCTTDVFVFMLMSCMSNFTKNQSDAEHNNIVTLSIKEQEKIAAKLNISDRAVRDSLKKLCELSLLHKCERENGKYIVNPFLSAKGEQNRIISLQHNFITKFVDNKYFNSCVDGDVDKNTATVVDKEIDPNFDII